MANTWYVGDSGFDIICDCGKDITGATSRTIDYTKPDGTTGSWDATIHNSNYLKYTTQTGDIDTPGVWFFHASFTLGDWDGIGELAARAVYRKFSG